MKLSFELNVKVTGESLMEVDEGLIQAAGERLKARILANPQTAMQAHNPLPPGLNIINPPAVTPVGMVSPGHLPPKGEAAIERAEEKRLHQDHGKHK